MLWTLWAALRDREFDTRGRPRDAGGKQPSRHGRWWGHQVEETGAQAPDASGDGHPLHAEDAGCPRSTGHPGGGDGGESNSPSRTLRRRPLRACPMVCRRPLERASAPCRAVQSRTPRSGLTPDYVTLVRIAAPLHDASTTREAEAASTLTLLPKQRERESTGGCQVLLFAT